MSFFQYLDREVNLEDVTDPNVSNLDKMKISKLICEMVVYGTAEGAEFSWEKTISISSVENLIECARKDLWYCAVNNGWGPGQYPHPMVDSIEFIISDTNNTYYSCTIE